ncbi:hypothetical protein [Pararhizobium haloflavum]|uniref:COG3904 family protein n=1 Tax=Pararhizobium haloflavum TaxID=2037914 RepID=UPI001FE1BFF0|nr:hypothetical protein [Pararhizobium haloflavum]
MAAGQESPAMQQQRASPWPVRRGSPPANSNDAGRERPASVPRLGFLRTLAQLDDGTLFKWLFRLILVGGAIVLALDLQAIREAATASDGSTPSTIEVLPPSLSDGKPDQPPFEITSDPATLRGALQFELLPEGTMLLQGAIDPGAADRFEQEIAERGEYVATIALDSPGGAVDDALAIGRLIRERGFGTRVESGALCASSCPIVLAGGIERTVNEEAVIGVHQVYGAASDFPSAAHAMSQAQHTTAKVSRYLEAMGIAPGLWLRALETPPDRLHYLTAQELEDFQVTTPLAE